MTAAREYVFFPRCYNVVYLLLFRSCFADRIPSSETGGFVDDRGETSCNCGRRRRHRRRSVCRTKTKSETDRRRHNRHPFVGGGEEGERENNAVRNARKTMVRKILDVLANASSTHVTRTIIVTIVVVSGTPRTDFPEVRPL